MSLPDDKLDLDIAEVDWSEHRDVLLQLRGTVFIEEQQVPREIEWDGRDEESAHVLVRAGDLPVGCGRLLPEGKIGRMAVLKEYRGRGIGAHLLREMLEAARCRSLTRVFLHAQSHALDFYARAGFVPEGEEFDEAGIPHRAMSLWLDYAGYDRFLSAVSYPHPFSQLALNLAETTDRQFRLFSPALDHAVFDSQHWVDALSGLARRSRASEVRLLVTDTRGLVKRGHRLVTLARRLPSSIAIRRITDYPDLADETYALRDHNGVVFKPAEAERLGFYEPGSRSSARKFLDRFDLLWERARSDPELRVLGI
jgi:predicted GNAT family N-acyltransferase